jgi:hypothetical protein
MFDGYEADTFVVDVDTMPTMGRVSTEDLVAHVIVDGHRHRRTPDMRETSCGTHELHSQYVVPLRDQLTYADGPMCEGCFTPHERQRARELDAAAARAAEEEQRRRDAEAEERRARRWRRPSSQGDR